MQYAQQTTLKSNFRTQLATYHSIEASTGCLVKVYFIALLLNNLGVWFMQPRAQVKSRQSDQSCIGRKENLLILCCRSSVLRWTLIAWRAQLFLTFCWFLDISVSFLDTVVRLITVSTSIWRLETHLLDVTWIKFLLLPFPVEIITNPCQCKVTN